ncbi:MAG: halocyanin [Bacteroidetes bacterium]|jgi:plastocyanin|nr:halocyanin [Bacteroidota bacterium]
MSFLKRYIFPLLLTTAICLFLIGALQTNQLFSQETDKEVKSSGQEPAVTVGMTNTMKFDADTVRINVGEMVEWKNSSLLAHSVTGDPAESSVEGSAVLPDGAKPFDSGMMDPEETFTHTFEVPGTYQYFCIPHEGAEMFGWVIVEE